MEVETVKKSQRETTLKIENLEKKSGANDASIANKIQEIEERISGIKNNFFPKENLWKRSEITDVSSTNRIQNIRDRRENVRCRR